MQTAIDSSVLWCLLNQEPGFEVWQAALWEATRDGELLVCSVAFAEISPAFESVEDVHKELKSLGARFDEISPEAAYIAGGVHLAYRRVGGPRQHMIPDFLIAAHAHIQADRLAAMDRGYLREYFPNLKLLQPATEASS